MKKPIKPSNTKYISYDLVYKYDGDGLAEFVLSDEVDRHNESLSDEDGDNKYFYSDSISVSDLLRFLNALPEGNWGVSSVHYDYEDSGMNIACVQTLSNTEMAKLEDQYRKEMIEYERFIENKKQDKLNKTRERKLKELEKLKKELEIS